MSRNRIRLGVIACLVTAVIAYIALAPGRGERRSREDELAYLRVAVPDYLLEYAHLDVATVEAVAIGGEGADQYLGLRVFHGQKRLHGGVRAEISVDYPFRPGDRVRYAWRFRVPEGFATDAPANRWWVIGQWHDQPDPRLGETWDQFPPRSPPVVLGLGESNGALAIGFGYGLTTDANRQQELGPLWIERGRWHHLTVVIHWSEGADGSAEVFLDNAAQPSLSARGPNMNNSYQHFWKLGQYRHPDIGADNWIYVDDLSAGPAPQPDAEPGTLRSPGPKPTRE